MATDLHREPWNKGIIVGQKAPLKLKEVWAIRMRLQLAHRKRELALFNLGVDSNPHDELTGLCPLLIRNAQRTHLMWEAGPAGARSASSNLVPTRQLQLLALTLRDEAMYDRYERTIAHACSRELHF
jgi:hypothetical protein